MGRRQNTLIIFFENTFTNSDCNIRLSFYFLDRYSFPIKLISAVIVTEKQEKTMKNVHLCPAVKSVLISLMNLKLYACFWLFWTNGFIWSFAKVNRNYISLVLTWLLISCTRYRLCDSQVHHQPPVVATSFWVPSARDYWRPMVSWGQTPDQSTDKVQRCRRGLLSPDTYTGPVRETRDLRKEKTIDRANKLFKGKRLA